MYFGSVKFFRHLILTVVFGWIAVATLLAVFFGIKCHRLESSDKKPETIEEYISQMTADGYTAEEIAAVLNRGSSLTAAEENIPAVNTAAIETEDIGGNASAEAPDTSETSAETAADAGEAADISELYPELAASSSGSPVTAAATDVFLTFEGDPSPNMADILIILDRRSAKAAFFLDSADVSEDDGDTVRLAVSRGNSIGVLAGADRSYPDAESYLADFNSLFLDISEVSGVSPVLYRIPDSADMTVQTRQEIISELSSRGFVYCEYNVLSDDTAPDSDWQEIYDKVTSRVFLNKVAEKGSVVLLHGGSDDRKTVYTVEDIISDMTAKGYSFKAYTGNTVI